MMDNQKKLEETEMLYQLASQLNNDEITIDDTLDKLNGDNNLIDIDKNNLVRFINDLADQIHIF